MRIIKRSLRLDCYKKIKGKPITKSNLGHILACSVNRFFFETIKYQEMALTYQNYTLLRESNNFNTDETTRLIRKYCPRFVESVVILTRRWLFVISFFPSIYNNPKVDDIADRLIVSYKNNLIAFIQRQSQYGKDYFELTIQFGYVELVVTSGFFSSVDNKLLGSSLHNLHKLITINFNASSTSMAFGYIQKKDHIIKNRIMNQYFKSHSVNKWVTIARNLKIRNFFLKFLSCFKVAFWCIMLLYL